MSANLYYYINTKGEKAIFNEQMSAAKHFSEGKGSYHRVRKEGRKTIRDHVIIDTKGNELFNTAKVLVPFSDGLICCEEGYRDEKGEIIIPIIWRSNYTFYKYDGNNYEDYDRKFRDGYKLIRKLGLHGKTGYMDSKGGIAIEPKYEQGTSFSKGYAIVELETKNGLEKLVINTKDEVLDKVPEEIRFNYFDDPWISTIDEEGFLPFIHNNQSKLCFWDMENEKILNSDIIFDLENSHRKHNERIGFYKGLCQVCYKGKWGMINTNFDWVIEPKYEEIGPMGDDLIPARKKDLYGYINIKGETVIDFKYKQISVFSDGLAAVNEVI